MVGLDELDYSRLEGPETCLIELVSRNLERLAEYGIVEFVDEGRSKRPVVPFDDIEVRLPLRGDDGDAREQAGA
mgnify:CR=1 FL=1